MPEYNYVIYIVIAVTIGVLTALIIAAGGYIRVKFKKMSAKNDELQAKNVAIQNGVQALLRDRIVQMYNDYIEKKYAPIYARENMECLYKEYKALDGNGTVSGLVKLFMELPTIPPGE